MPIQPLLQIEGALIRRALPDLLLRPGQTIAARVAERSGRHGIITIAGAPLVAELPEEVKAGDRLQLAVQEATVEKVVLKLVPDQPIAAPPPAEVPLPGDRGATVKVEEREGGGGADAERAAISLVYSTPALGDVRLRLELVPGAIVARAELRAGLPFELADEAAGALRDRLAEVTGRAAEVRVSARRESFDAYA